MIQDKDICNFEILRDLRKRESMSIQDLSAKSGVSASVISKLERNQTSAETDTLYRIARVFGMTLSDLFLLAENRISHRADAETYEYNGFHFERVSYGNMRCMHAAARKGSAISTPELHRDDYELCWVLRGKIRLTLPKESHELESGMSLQFDALLEHSYEALEDSELILVHLRKPKRF